jgi:hypothetical protein
MSSLDGLIALARDKDSILSRYLHFGAKIRLDRVTALTNLDRETKLEKA